MADELTGLSLTDIDADGALEEVAAISRPGPPAVRRAGLQCERVGRPADDERERHDEREVDDHEQRTRLDVADLAPDTLPCIPQTTGDTAPGVTLEWSVHR
jgi:hypothetical protein